jgi:hypothetical protein
VAGMAGRAERNSRTADQRGRIRIGGSVIPGLLALRYAGLCKTLGYPVGAPSRRVETVITSLRSCAALGRAALRVSRGFPISDEGSGGDGSSAADRNHGGIGLGTAGQFTGLVESGAVYAAGQLTERAHRCTCDGQAGQSHSRPDRERFSGSSTTWKLGPINR